MKVGFSTICCPAWSLRTVFENAVRLGCSGIELRGLEGELHLPNHAELAQNHEAVVQVCEKANVELVCLGTSCFFGSKKRLEIADQKGMAREYIELAEKLHCPYVRVFTGDVPRGSDRMSTLSRIAEALRELVDFSAGHRVKLLVENSGDLSSSKDLWFILDAVPHPALAACLNAVNCRSVGERPTIAVPRLVSRLGLVHVADATFEGLSLDSYKPMGEGNLGVERLVDLLRGVFYDGFVMIEWPKLWNKSLTDPEKYLPDAVSLLKAQTSKERKPLTAYKSDKGVKYQDSR